MNMTEQALLFPCADNTLIGILSLPATPAKTAVLMVVGGPQYRAGSHRQFVLLARKLAAEGYAVLRFDYRGMGDSSGPAGNFLTCTPDIGAAIDALQNHVPSAQNIVLWGLCDAASAALLYLYDTQDKRIGGLCLLNPWVRSEASLARTQVKHYYIQRLMQRSFWTKLLKGKVALGAIQSLAKNIRLSTGAMRTTNIENRPFQEKMAMAWMKFTGNILLILSGDDYTAKEFLEFTGSHVVWSQALQHTNLNRENISDADHTFSRTIWKEKVEIININWLNSKYSNKINQG